MSSPIVLLSSFSDEQRRKFTSLTEKLGGRVLQSVGYDQRCTHVVVGTILSTEKLLAGAIAGKWVVSPEYIECSYKAKKWLEAERFVLQTVGSGNVKKLSEVPTRWRNFRLQNGNQGPFRSWRVLLALPDADKIRYKRLLQAGGAHVISDKPPYVWSLKTSDRLTYVFTNKELFITVMSLHKRGVPCVHPDYVKDYIIQHHQPDASKYRANVYSRPDKKPTTCGYRKITSYIFTTPKSSSSSTRGLCVRDKNTSHLPRKVETIKQNHSNHLLENVKSLTVSIPLGKILLKKIPLDKKILLKKRSCDDDVIDLTVDSVSSCDQPSSSVSTQSSSDCIVLDHPPTDCVESQPPSDCVESQPPSDCVMSQPPTDCVMSQPPTDCVVSHSSANCVTSQACANHVTLRPPADCIVPQSSADRVVSQPAFDCVTLQESQAPPTDCVMSQAPSDCVTSQALTDDDTFQCTNEDMDQTLSDEVLAARLRFSSEGAGIKRCGKKRRRKCVSVPELPTQETVQQYNIMIKEEEDGRVVSKIIKIDHLPIVTVMLHQRGLWTSRLMEQHDHQVVLKTSVDTLLEGYLTDQQSLSRGVKYCHSLITLHHVPSPTLLHQLTSKLMSDQLDNSLVAMVSMTLSKLLLLHPPHGNVARQQYYKLFDMLIDTKSEYRKWEGLFQGIMGSRPHLLQYLTDIIILDYHRWLLSPSHGDQPLLHQIMWAGRSCDAVSRPIKELSQHFIQLLDNYHDDKHPYLECVCYLMFLIGHYLQLQSATPTAAPPPHLQAARLAYSMDTRQNTMSRVKCYYNIDDYCNYLQHIN